MTKQIKPKQSWRIDVLLMAAGASTRMRGPDKLVMNIDGQALLRRSAVALASRRIARLHVVLASGGGKRVTALKGLDVHIVCSPFWEDGLSASIVAGMAAVAPSCDGVIIALADMPEVNSTHLDALINAYSPTHGREICRAVTADGQPGHPVLFGRRFFPHLLGLKSGQGARDIIAQAPEAEFKVTTSGNTAVTDLDTPESWDAWLKRR